MQSIDQAPIKKGTKVFVAGDLDVPFDNNKIADTYRLDCMVPTIKYIIEKGGQPIIGGHIGRPNGKVVAELSTQKLVSYFDNKVGAGKYALLENLRFDPREDNNDEGYSQKLAALADIYVNEVFSTSHRNAASITGVPKYLPHYAGFRLTTEVNTLTNLLKNPARPFVVIIGGAKLEDKKPVVFKFLEIADLVLTGGKIALQWEGKIPGKLRIPTDYANEQKDIGPETINAYKQVISESKTVLWAGPLGMYEIPEYNKGNEAVAQALANATSTSNATTVCGGGDTVDVLTMLKLRDKVSFVSTGGGAMLEFLVQGTLPGIQALE